MIDIQKIQKMSETAKPLEGKKTGTGYTPYKIAKIINQVLTAMGHEGLAKVTGPMIYGYSRKGLINGTPVPAFEDHGVYTEDEVMTFVAKWVKRETANLPKKVEEIKTETVEVKK